MLKLQESQRDKGEHVESASARLREVQAQSESVQQTLQAQRVVYALAKLPLRLNERLTERLLAAAEGACPISRLGLCTLPMLASDLLLRAPTRPTQPYTLISMCAHARVSMHARAFCSYRAAGEYQPSASEAELDEHLAENRHVSEQIDAMAMQLSRQFESLAPQITSAVQQSVY